MIDLLKKNGPWFKANLHCHTTLSDGKMTAAQVKAWYKSHGYSIVAYTDHSKYAWYPELQDDDFLPVAGVETAFTCLDLNNKPLKYKLCHINFWAKDPEKSQYIPEEPTYDVGVINRYIAAMKKKGWLCGLNHPAWSRQTTEEVNGISGIDTFEIYNHGSQYLDNNGDGQIQYSMYLSEGKRAWCISVDDNHAGFEPDGQICDADDTLGGYIMMSIPELNYANFLLDGIDRPRPDGEHAWKGVPGDRITYSFAEPTAIRRIRFVFDSDLNRETLPEPENGMSRPMFHNRPKVMQQSHVPTTMLKAYRITAKTADGHIHVLADEINNYQRLRIHDAALENCLSITLEPIETWGQNTVRIFAFEAQQ